MVDPGCVCCCVLCAGITHANRIAQAAAVRVELNSPVAGATMEDTALAYMQLDGEPWAQVIPAGWD